MKRSIAAIVAAFVITAITGCNPIGQFDSDVASNTCDARYCDPVPEVVASNSCNEQYCDPVPTVASNTCDARYCDPVPSVA